MGVCLGARTCPCLAHGPQPLACKEERKRCCKRHTADEAVSVFCSVLFCPQQAFSKGVSTLSIIKITDGFSGSAPPPLFSRASCGACRRKRLFLYLFLDFSPLFPR
eukprot:2214215-Rhodomonas_salina.1